LIVLLRGQVKNLRSHADKNQDQSKDRQTKHNVLGYFDGRPLTILPARRDGSAHDVPAQFENVATFYFLAHRLGELNIVAGHRGISFDLSFDEDSAGVVPQWFLGVTSGIE